MPSPQPLAGQVPYPPPASFAATTTAPPRPCSRRGRIPKRALRAWNAHTTALFVYECQSFLDNFIAGLGQIGSWNDPRGDTLASLRRGSRRSSYGSRANASVFCVGNVANRSEIGQHNSLVLR